MLAIRYLVVSLIVGALCGWVMSTKFHTHHALLGAAAATVFMGGSLAYIEHHERRNPARRAEGEEQDA
jgi:hypothetical protein